MADDLSATIVTNATGPQSTTADGTTTTSQSVAGQVLADQYVNGKAAMRKRGRGLRFMKFVLGGQVSGIPGAGGSNGLV